MARTKDSKKSAFRKRYRKKGLNEAEMRTCWQARKAEVETKV